MRLQADHLGLDLPGELAVDVLEVGGLAAAAGAVVDNLHLDDFFPEIDEAHNRSPVASGGANLR